MVPLTDQVEAYSIQVDPTLARCQVGASSGQVGAPSGYVGSPCGQVVPSLWPGGAPPVASWGLSLTRWGPL